MRRTRLRIPYLISDFVLSAFSWLLVWYLRSSLFSSGYASELNGTLILKCIAVGLGWLGLYKAFGLYRDTYRDSRTKELGLLLESNILGVVVLAFFLLFDDPFQNYADLQLAILYYQHPRPLAAGKDSTSYPGCGHGATDAATHC
jgi:hypothetical protein